MFRLIVAIFVFVAPPLGAVDMQAFRHSQGTNYEISDLFFSNEPIEFAFELTVSEPQSGSFKYLLNGKEALASEVVLSSDEVLSFPGEERVVELGQGIHSFQFLSGDIVVEQRTVVVKDPQDMAGVNFSIPAGESVAPSKLMKFSSVQIPNVAPINVSTPRLRSVGAKIFKEHSNSVVLVVTDDGMGSGSIVSDDGLILTNWHVIGEASEALVVFRPKGFAAVETSENYTADVLVADKSADLALLKLKYLTRKLDPITIADEATIEIAEDVHAIGHPKGNFWTYTKGVISQIRPKYEWTGDGIVFHKADVLQTQTPINPGNSGGPLLDDEGRMVGVNSFGDSDADGLNYAIASSSVLKFLASAPKSKPSTENSVNEPNIIGTDDRNDDGYPDLWYVDHDKNGRIDGIEQDTNYDGLIDVVFVDENENGTAEMIFDYIDVNGETVLVVSIDDDEDGIRDRIAYDYDNDGEIDKIENA